VQNQNSVAKNSVMTRGNITTISKVTCWISGCSWKALGV